MNEIVVPDPDPEWASALQPPYSRRGDNRNPAQQYFAFEEAMGRYRELATLRLNISDIARRLRLMLEPGHADQLGAVDVAFFSIRRTGFAVHRYGSDEWTMLSIIRQHEAGEVEAVDIMLEALGVDWRAVEMVNFGDRRGPLFLEPVLDDDLRPAFPGSLDDTKHSGSGI